MKRSNRRIALILCVLLLLETLTFGSAFAATADSTADVESTVLYEEGFNGNIFGNTTPPQTPEGVWVNENPTSGNGKSFTAALPRVEDGVMKLQKGESAQFNWLDLESFSFDRTKTYTFKFDVTLTDTGNDTAMSQAAAWKRELYVAPGGYYNQVEFRNDNGTKALRAGDSYAGSDAYKLNTKYSVEIVWTPSSSKITSTIKEGDTVVVTGFRTGDAYSNADSYLAHWVFRCEDGACEIDNFSFTDGTNTHTQNFDTSPFEATEVPKVTDVWSLEVNEVANATAPAVDGGILKFTDKDSVCFNWTNVEGVGEYDISKAYIFEFDVKITDKGDDQNTWTSSKTRAMYVAMGGYYNQVEFVTKDNQVRAGDTYAPFNESVYLNKKLHVKVSLEGGSINSAIYDENGNVLISGTRTSGEYTDMTVHGAAMTYLVLRCEDGAAEVDNFKFSTAKIKTASSDKLTIPNGKAAIYKCDINVTANDSNTVKLNGVEVFSVASGAMMLCGNTVGGNYGEGKYSVTLTVNPDQKMANVEVVLPNGGVVRRGSYSTISSSVRTYGVEIFAEEANVSNVSTSYSDVNLNSYNVYATEPQYEGFGAKVYNLITAFDDARTTRSFAWTALKSYIGNDAMALKYRKAGDVEWKTVDAIREDEGLEIPTEDYFKVDITGLTENTSYEYKIGKKNSTDEANDWSKTYTFKTENTNADSFTFVALGDTQGITWSGMTNSTKGFMFAKTAYEEAIEETENPAFILHTGDVVQNGESLDQWNMFFKALGDYGATVPHFTAIGNHDVKNIGTTVPEFYFDLHFNHPNNGGNAALDPTQVANISNAHLKALAKDAEETVYSYNYGNAHFIVLNSGNYTSNDMYMLEAQRKWLEADLKANEDAKWTIITVHEPVYHRLGGNESRPWLGDLIEEYGVDLVIQGHSHLVTRTYPMKDGKIVTKESPDLIKKGTGTVYTTIGATAYNHDSMGNPNVEECLMIATPSPELAAYTVVTVSDSKIVMTVKQIDGLVLDSFTIEDDGESTDTPVTPDVTTTAPNANDTTAPNGNETTAVSGNEDPDVTTAEKGNDSATATKKKGCGGFAFAAQLITLLGAAVTVVVFKKK